MQNIFNRLVRASTRLAGQARRLIPSYGRSTRFNGVSPRIVDIFGRVQIAVMVFAALWTIPFPHGKRETGQNVAAPVTALTAGEEAVHKPQLPSVSLAFVSEHPPELAKRSIGKGFRQGSIFNHTPDIQVFDADLIVSTHQISGHFIQVILSGVADMFLYSGNADALSVPHTATFDATGENPLGPGKANLVFVRMLWIGDSLTVAGSGKSANSKINSHRLTDRFEFRKLFVQDQSNKVTSAGTLCDRYGRGLRLELPTPIYVETAQPRDNQIRVVGVWTGELESRSRVFCALLVPTLLERRILGLLVEELHEGVVQMPERLLDRNAGDFSQPRGFLLTLPLGQLGGGLAVTNPFVPLLPSVRPIPQCPVVSIPATTEDLRKLGLLGLGWCKPKLVSHFHTNNLYP